MVITSAEIETLVEQFQKRTLPDKEWTHEAHLVVACWTLMKYPKDEATHYLRTSIISYHSILGGAHTLSRGYHETITLFWVEVIHQFLNTIEGDVATKINAFMNSDWASKDVFFKYYTENVLFSVKARARYVAPDIQPIKITPTTIKNDTAC